MCWHKWKEYKDLNVDRYYRICQKCGIAQELGYNDGWGMSYKTKPNLCRTNFWIDRETFKLRYGG